MVRPLRLLLVACATAALLVACGDDPVADEPELEGVATVRVLDEAPAASTEDPEVSGERTVRFRYSSQRCGVRDVEARPQSVAATYTIDTVALIVVPSPADCPAEDQEMVTRGLEVFLDEPVDGRTVSVSVDAP